MSSFRLYQILEISWVYRLTRLLLAPGADRLLMRLLRNVLETTPPGTRILDVGCGPSSWLARAGFNALGSDISQRYMREYRRAGHSAVVNSADALPFARGVFDSVWTIGLLHHLSDAAAFDAIREMMRVCRPGGYVVIIDAVMPRSVWRRPLAYALRRLDRGRFVRSEQDFLAMAQQALPFEQQMRRFTFTYNGMEVLLCSTRIQGR
jgi:SAM-dependent methyltransferase